jgi:hypothetical protein
VLVQRRRDSRAALRLMRKLLKKQGFAPKLLVTDKLRSYAAAFRRLRPTCPHEQRKRTRQLDSSFVTLHWREMDSNPRFLFAGLGRPTCEVARERLVVAPAVSVTAAELSRPAK